MTFNTIDDDIANSELAERVELPIEKWRMALFTAKAAIVASQKIEDFRNGSLNVTYGELVYGLELILDSWEYDALDKN